MSRRTAWWAVLVALLLSGAVLGLLGEGERAQRPTDSLPSGLDSTEAVQLEEELGQSSARVAVVLFTTEDGTIDAGLRRQVERLATRVGAPPGTVQVAEDRTAAVAVVPVDAGSATETIDLVGELRDRLDAAAPDGVTAQVTGPAGIEADLAQVFDGADTRLLMITAGVVALLLVLTYRSPVLWLVPLLVVGVADRVASILATQALAALDVAWDESTIGILSVLVFGAGTDYALLLISRYRDELRSHASRHAAMARAWRRTLEPVLASSVTVTVGLLTLLLSLTPTTRGLGLACAIGVLVAAAYVLLVLPCALVLCGRWVFWPRVPREGDTALVDGRSLWRRVGDAVARRPAALATSTLALLALLSVGLLRVDVGLSQSEQFLDEPEAISAAERLAESFPAGAANPTTVVTRADPQRVVALVTDSPGVADARVTATGDGVARIDVVLADASGSAGSREAIAELRAAVAGLGDTHVGGDEAAELDEREGAARDRLLIWPLILVLVLGALVLLLRSVLAPVLLVATVVATYAASMGASWWLFTGPLGFTALDSQVPLFAFLFLVALGVDYNIFLVTRAREEARGHGTRSGMLRALAATGGVITSAGILLAAVFAVLGVLPLVVLAQLGLIICLGVLLDTLLVRTVLVPALALLLGERFWWPGRPSASAG